MSFMFTQQDREQLQRKGVTPEIVEQQLAIFRRGIPYTRLDRPCVVEDGIKVLTASDIDHYIEEFHQAMTAGRVTKFVPASGAASRMFKSLLAYWNHTQTTDHDQSIDNVPEIPEQKQFNQFIEQIELFAFYDDLKNELLKHGHQISHLLSTRPRNVLLSYLLFSPGLDYGTLPKGLIKFHRYGDHDRTPIEEHLVEGLEYAKDSTGTTRVHFTISPEHEKPIQQHLEYIRARFEQKEVNLEVTLSQQKSSTDTLAVDMNNQPFRNAEGQLVFRPGGHGALLENLYDVKGDIVFIKNIDNVVPDRLKESTNRYKQALGGFLVSVQKQVFAYVRTLSSKQCDAVDIQSMATFARHSLSLTLPSGLLDWPLTQQTDYFLKQFHRPIRVCGMVLNAGEPGGGPFWVRQADGSCTPQVVESSQVDPHSAEQQQIFKSSTHFNPVDLVCGVRDFQNQPFDLTQFVDQETGFISQKSFEGRTLKALELPGLWNGAMAHWITLFVEVPLITFNPVKTVYDLLRPEHQPEPTTKTKK